MNNTQTSNPRSAQSKYKNREDLAATGERLKLSAHVPQGMGGIYTFPLELPFRQGDEGIVKTTIIGTTGCSTCVGVYIPIDDDRCFAAHFDGASYKRPRNSSVYQVPDALAEYFKLAVKTSLDHVFKGKEQDVETIRRREDLKARAVVVSTWLVVGGQKGPGFYIIDVLCDYFQLDKLKLASKCSAHHGFVVDHCDQSSQSLHLLGWTRPAPDEKVFDEISKLADSCPEPGWDEKFMSIYRTTYEWVMPWNAGWWARPLLNAGEKKPFRFRYYHDEAESGKGRGKWGVGP
ncbi:uncharacterized protein RCC_06409 [Ramularia collo-cygni]|uniref:Uncharacterized protein n=1 Tax=Ramularia collo-cygni TaxID=112498 RepID=A0A2D3UV71_9PEZI|nr:uncharacterized protein RCC_06409 [Ramularia collo-cygni]CZT20551.1 uncharacterized protein RCC_06409 [Ramularia collo-cygni]